MTNILIVDDETLTCRVLSETLASDVREVRTVDSAEAALELLETWTPHVAFVDLLLPGLDGLLLLQEMRRRSEDTEVVLITAHASVDAAVAALKHGAFDFLRKPMDRDLVELTVERALEKRALRLDHRRVENERDEETREKSAAVLRLTSLIEAGRAMGEFRTLPDLLDFFIGLVARELGVARASLMLLDDSDETLHIAASRGIPDEVVQDAPMPVGSGVAGLVAASGEPFLVHDVQNDPRVDGEGDPGRSNSFISAPIVLSIPIKSRESVLGVINVTNRKSQVPFSESDMSYLSGLAGQLAVAIEAARQFEQLREAYDSLKSTQEQLVVSERNKAIGQIAAGVAHDFNNSLSVILGRSQFALTRLDELPTDSRTELLDHDLRMIEKVALQAAEAIKRIQDYSRVRQDVQRTAIELNEIVREAVEMNRPKWAGESELEGREIEVAYELNDVHTVSGNFHELTQVVSNLLFNAVEAMHDGGRLVFRTFEDDGEVVLEIEDTGAGMEEDVRRRLFEPSFTTKEHGQGLGTSIAFGIVKRHGGDVTVKSRLGEGTTFRITLPALGAESTTQTGTPWERHDAPSARILLVEDDAGVREIYEEVLRSCGHEVSCAGNGVEALNRFEQGTFDVVVTDLSMPGMSGLDLARSVKQRVPGLPIVLFSGWALHQKKEEIDEAGIDCVLSKPCLNETLLDAIHQVLARESGRGGS
ncbi:MAG: response regulator [bacterium]|nr:response regulator [bacterium]